MFNQDITGLPILGYKDRGRVWNLKVDDKHVKKDRSSAYDKVTAAEAARLKKNKKISLEEQRNEYLKAKRDSKRSGQF